jgi:hypothetical protein
VWIVLGGLPAGISIIILAMQRLSKRVCTLAIKRDSAIADCIKTAVKPTKIMATSGKHARNLSIGVMEYYEKCAKTYAVAFLQGTLCYVYTINHNPVSWRKEK